MITTVKTSYKWICTGTKIISLTTIQNLRHDSSEQKTLTFGQRTKKTTSFSLWLIIQRQTQFPYFNNKRTNVMSTFLRDTTMRIQLYRRQSESKTINLGCHSLLLKRHATKILIVRVQRCQNNLTNPEKCYKDERAIKWKTPKSHPPWCPGRIWALIVDRIWSNKGSTNDTPVNAIIINDEHHLIKTSTVSRWIRRAIIKPGEEPLSMNTEISTTQIKTYKLWIKQE
jgi:hypothetical protein